jgi:hypothetical protein
MLSNISGWPSSLKRRVMQRLMSLMSEMGSAFGQNQRQDFLGGQRRG